MIDNPMPKEHSKNCSSQQLNRFRNADLSNSCDCAGQPEVKDDYGMMEGRDFIVSKNRPFLPKAEGKMTLNEGLNQFNLETYD